MTSPQTKRRTTRAKSLAVSVSLADFRKPHAAGSDLAPQLNMLHSSGAAGSVDQREKVKKSPKSSAFLTTYHFVLDNYKLPLYSYPSSVAFTGWFVVFQKFRRRKRLAGLQAATSFGELLLCTNCVWFVGYFSAQRSF